MKWPNLPKVLLFSFWAISLTEISKLLSYHLSSYDFWWHLAAGRAMIESKTFLRTDIFSHTMFGQEWINFEWLAQVIMMALYDAVGPQGMVLIKVQIVWIALLLIVYSAYRLGARGPSLLLVMWLAYYLVRPRSFVRPELATLLFIPVFVALILVARESTGRQKNIIMGAMTAIMILWSNMHGGFVYGIAVVGLFWLGSLWSGEKKPFQVFLFRCSIVLFLASFINPYGYKIYEVLLIHMGQFKEGPILISEWKPPGIKAVPVFWTLFFVAGYFLVNGILRRDPKTKFWTPVVFVFLLWGSSHYRNTTLIAFVVLPFLVESYRFGLQPQLRPRWLKVAAIAAWVLCFIPIQGKAKVLTRPWPKHVIKWHNYPYRSCDVVRNLNIQGTLFNDYHFGGYIQYALGPKRKVFLDGRYLFYPVLAEYAPYHTVGTLKQSKALWKRHFDFYKIDYAIVSNKKLSYPVEKMGRGPLRHGLAMFPKESWALIHWDDESHLYVKRVPKFESIIREREYKALLPFNIEEMGHLLKTGQIGMGQIKKEIETHKTRVKKSYLRNFIARWVKKKEKTK